MLSERQARLRTRTLGWASLAVLLIVGIVTQSGSVIFYLAALLPWIAALVYRTGDGVIQLFVGKRDRRPNVTHVLGFSLMWPGMWALMSDPSPLRWELLLALGAVVGCLFSAVVVREFREWHWATLLALLVGTSCYGFGVIAALNQDLDSGSQQIYAPQVLSKRITRFRRSDYYYVKVAPWGPQLSAREVSVPRRVYEGTPVGQPVFIHLYPGALRIPWFCASIYR